MNSKIYDPMIECDAAWTDNSKEAFAVHGPNGEDLVFPLWDAPDGITEEQVNSGVVRIHEDRFTD